MRCFGWNQNTFFTMMKNRNSVVYPKLPCEAAWHYEWRVAIKSCRSDSVNMKPGKQLQPIIPSRARHYDVPTFVFPQSLNIENFLLLWASWSIHFGGLKIFEINLIAGICSLWVTHYDAKRWFSEDFTFSIRGCGLKKILNFAKNLRNFYSEFHFGGVRCQKTFGGVMRRATSF